MRIILLVLTILIFSTVSASAQSNDAQDAKNFDIALIVGLSTDSFYITMNKGAQAAAEALGVNVTFQGPQKFSPVAQSPVLNAVIARNPDAILIAPTDSKQMIAPLRKAHKAGIPVITLDTYIGNGKYQNGKGSADFPISYIASNNLKGGRIAARYMAKAIEGKGSVYVSNVRPGISSTDQRERGFISEMKENYPKITVLSTQYNNNSASKAAAQLQAVLARYPDLKGVFGANLFSALGAANGVKSAGMKDEITVVAFDAPPSIVHYLEDGLVDAVIAQHPATLGWYGVVTAYRYLSGHAVPPKIETGFTIIDESNYKDEDIAKFIYTTNR